MVLSFIFPVILRLSKLYSLSNRSNVVLFKNNLIINLNSNTAYKLKNYSFDNLLNLNLKFVS